MELFVTAVLRDEGSIVVFSGITTESDTLRTVSFAVDHRMAQPIADALSSGEDVYVDVEHWQVIG